MKTRHLPSILLACLFLLVSVSSFADDDNDNPQNTPGTPVTTAYFNAPNVYITVTSNGATINETGVYYRKDKSALSELSGTRFYTTEVKKDQTFTMDMHTLLENKPGTYFFRAYAKHGISSHAYSDVMTLTITGNSTNKVALIGQPLNTDYLEFVAPVKGVPIAKSLFLQIENMASDATLAITDLTTGAAATTFVVSPTLISPGDLANGVTITVTYSGNRKSANANLQITGSALEGLGHTVIALKGTGTYTTGDQTGD